MAFLPGWSRTRCELLRVTQRERWVTRQSCRMKGLFVRWKAPVAHVRGIFSDGAGNRFPDMRESARELWRVLRAQTNHVMQHQYLAIGIRTRADTNRGNMQFARNFRAQLARNRFEHHGERAGRFHSTGIAPDL